MYMNTTNRILIWPSVAIAAAVLFLGTAAAVFAASPTVSFSGGSTPGATLSVSGSGFQANESVHLMLGINSADTHADASGNFSGTSLTIPNVPSGNYIVIALGQNSGLVSFAYLYVSGFFPNASPSSWYLTPGSTLTWSGTGFAPNETVTISNAGGQIASFNADNSGSFTGQGASTVPYSAHGSTVTYTVHGSVSSANSTLVLAVADLFPWVNPSAWYILPGSSVTFTGGGFGPSEGISVYYGTSTSPVAHFSADASGNFTAQGSVTIPYGTGTANYKLIGDSSGAVAMAPITRALFYPSLNPSAYYSAPGGFITLSGSGFVPGEDVVLTVNGTAAGTAHTDSMGAFSGQSIHVSTTPNSTATIQGVGQTSGATASFGMAIGAYYTWEELSTWWAMGGSPLTITGHNFAAGETVNASSGSQDLGSGTASNTGDVTIMTHVPHGASGPASVTLTGQTSGAPASVTMTISPVWTDFELGAYAGAPGDAVRLAGHGYQFNEPVVITTDRTGTSPVATLTSDSSGSFDDSSWHVPADFAEGNLAITATGQWSGDVKTITYYVTGH